MAEKGDPARTVTASVPPLTTIRLPDTVTVGPPVDGGGDASRRTPCALALTAELTTSCTSRLRAAAGEKPEAVELLLHADSDRAAAIRTAPIGRRARMEMPAPSRR